MNMTDMAIVYQSCDQSAWQAAVNQLTSLAATPAAGLMTLSYNQCVAVTVRYAPLVQPVRVCACILRVRMAAQWDHIASSDPGACCQVELAWRMQLTGSGIHLPSWV